MTEATGIVQETLKQYEAAGYAKSDGVVLSNGDEYIVVNATTGDVTALMAAENRLEEDEQDALTQHEIVTDLIDSDMQAQVIDAIEDAIDSSDFWAKVTELGQALDEEDGDDDLDEDDEDDLDDEDEEDDR
jgi:hypothetical protein